MYMDHMVFIHSSVDGHLGRFRLLALVNSAAVNAEAHVSFRVRVFSGYVSRSGILDHMVVLFLVL